MPRTSTLLATARRGAGLTQRQLSALTGIPQASISRIEGGLVAPRTATVEPWLRACGLELDARPAFATGVGIDRGLIRERLAMTVSQRSDVGTQEAWALRRLERGHLRRRQR